MRGSFILGLVVAFLISMALVIPLQLFDIRAGESKSSDLAAWAQAFGSILAVAVALLFPIAQEEFKERKKINEMKKALELETQAILGQLNRALQQAQRNEINIIHPVDFYFKDKIIELSQLGNEMFFIGTNLREKINKLNNYIEDTKRKNTVYSRGDLLKEIISCQEYIQRKQDRLVVLRMRHHTAPPSA
jgi:hypothetical protein